MDSPLTLVRISTAGSVDDGKSTLIGRLLHDSQQVYSDQMEAARSSANRLGKGMEFAFLMDGLKAEREQGITIDVAYRYFRTAKRAFIIADTPGHEQYTRNMVTGASTADIAVILLDAQKGVLTQSRRHAFIANLLGINHIVVAVNKMDLVDYCQERFDAVVADFTEFASRLDIGDLRFVPMSALNGDNVTSASAAMPWYQGPSLLTLLEEIYIGGDRNMIDLRFPVQLVSRPDHRFRGYAGQVVSGIMRKGDRVMVLPSTKTTQIASIQTHDGDLEEAFPPMSVTVTLSDELDISRGDMIVHTRNRPRSSRLFEAMLVWMDETPMDPSVPYLIKLQANTARARLVELRYKMNIDTLHRTPSTTLALNEIGRVVLATQTAVQHDPYTKNRATGCAVLIDPRSNHTVAAAIILDREPTDQLPVVAETWHELKHSQSSHSSRITTQQRMTRAGYQAVTIWLTGLVGSGKRDMAYQLEYALWLVGTQVTVLDGGKLRQTLSSDLDFTNDDTTEHLRRAAETARLMNDAGMVVICAFVSPLQGQRDMARDIIGSERFIEVLADKPVEECEAADNQGLYVRARAGVIRNLAGVNAPFERPLTGFQVATGDAASVAAFIDVMIERLNRPS